MQIMELTKDLFITEVIKTLTIEQLVQQMDRIKREIQEMADDLTEDAKPHRGLYTAHERDRIKLQAMAKCDTYEIIYNEWLIRTKVAYVRQWMLNSPVIKKYKDLKIIVD